MYLLTIRDGLQTRHVGPFATPAQAAADLDQLLPSFGERAHWQIHVLESPEELLARAARDRGAAAPSERSDEESAVAAA
jgi:hypothetical protein